MKRRLLAVGVTVALATALAGCAPAESPEPGSQEPLKFMTIATLESPQYSAGQTEGAVEAAVAAINDEGGIDGRLIEMSFCNDSFDPNQTAQCARQAVDEGVVAVLGGSTVMAANAFPVLQAAGIPWIMTSGSAGVVELSDEISFPLNGGVTVMSAGVAVKAVELGGENLSLITNDNEGAMGNALTMKEYAEANGATVNLVSVPLDAVDYSAAVSAALENDPDAVMLMIVPQSSARAVQGLRQAGYDGLIVAPSSLFPAAVLEALGDAAEGTVLIGRSIPSVTSGIPEIEQFIAEMEATSPDTSRDDIALTAWTGVHFIAKLLTGKTVSGPEDVIAALTSVEDPISLGVVPDYIGPQDPPTVAAVPRVGVFEAVMSIVTDGVPVSDGKFFEPEK